MKYQLRNRSTIKKKYDILNEVKFTKEKIKKLHRLQNIKRAQSAKYATRRRKKKAREKNNNLEKNTRKELNDISALHTRIKDLGKNYEGVIYNYLGISYDADLLTKLIQYDSLQKVIDLVSELEYEISCGLNFNFRSRVCSKLMMRAPHMSNSMMDKIEKLYSYHYTKRFNKKFELEEMDYAFPFPIRGMQQIERLVDGNKKLVICLKKK